MRRALSALTPFAALAVLCVVLVSPVGDFPLNDDWVYGKMARWFAEEGSLRLHPFTQAYCLTQVVWAFPFIKVFGFSFSVLRVSTLILAVVTAWVVARCGRELGLPRRVAMACAMVLFCNPLFLNLSYTFMTEIPFLCCLALSCLFYLRALRTGVAAAIFWGTVWAVAAFFCRQFGLLSTLAFVFTAVLFWKQARPHVRLGTVAALVVPWIPAVAGVLWLSFNDQRPFLPSASPDRFAPVELTRAGSVALSVGLYLGLFVMPISAGIVWALLRGRTRWSRSAWLVALIAGGVLAAGLVFDPRPIPRLPNLLRNLGVGPVLLTDAYHPLRPWSPYTLNPVTLWIFTVLSLASAAVGAGALWTSCAPLESKTVEAKTKTRRVRRAQRVLLAALSLLLLLAPYNPQVLVYYDRYLLPPLFPICLIAASSLPWPRKVGLFRPVAFACAMSFVFSVVCLQDYMAWNRARWQGIDALRTKWQARDTQIDGGYEFNGMYTSDDFVEQKKSRLLARPGKKGWWIVGARYRIAMHPVPNYRVIGRTPYVSWLGFTTRDILILRKK